MPQYATTEQYTTYAGGTTTDRVLKAASLRIDELLVGVVYDVDDDTQLPTDDTVADALMAATCEQALWMDEQGDTSGSGASDASALQSASIGSVSYSKDTKATETNRKVTSSGASVAPGAIAVLTVEGLLPGWAIVSG